MLEIGNFVQQVSPMMVINQCDGPRYIITSFHSFYELLSDKISQRLGSI